MSMMSELLLTCISVCLFALFSSGLKIKQLNVPRLFDRTLNHTLAMDCDYVYTENDLYLVVRWFYHGTTDRPEPFYQWIPERGFRYVAEDYKTFFHLEAIAKASDPYTKYRSVVLHNPMPYMSGKYTCKVSSLANSDSMEANVYIYASPKTFIFQSRIDATTGNLLLRCRSLGAYPEPEVSIWKQTGGWSGHAKSANTLNYQVLTVNKSVSNSSQLFDTTIDYMLSDKELIETAFARSPKLFECRVTIKQANYQATKRITLYSSKSPPKHGPTQYAHMVLASVFIINLGLFSSMVKLFAAYYI